MVDNKYNKKMWRIHKMCFDCVIEMEHELKKQGTYQEYEQNKIRENALAWLRDAERDVELLKQAYTQAQEFVSNSDGITETWTAKMTAEEFDQTIQKQFEEFKTKFLENLNKETKQNEND
jgi:succinylglutamate desuccinylase